MHVDHSIPENSVRFLAMNCQIMSITIILQDAGMRMNLGPFVVLPQVLFRKGESGSNNLIFAVLYFH